MDSEAFVKIKKKNWEWGRRLGGVRVDVNGEVKFFVKIQEKIFFRGGGSDQGLGWGRG